MLPRLDELEADLLDRRTRAEAEAWLGEIEGIDLTLSLLREKRQSTRRMLDLTPRVHLRFPAVSQRHLEASLCQCRVSMSLSGQLCGDGV
jgi:hypothetical protein